MSARPTIVPYGSIPACGLPEASPHVTTRRDSSRWPACLSRGPAFPGESPKGQIPFICVSGPLAGLMTPFFESPLRQRAAGFADPVDHVRRLMRGFYPTHSTARHEDIGRPCAKSHTAGSPDLYWNFQRTSAVQFRKNARVQGTKTMTFTSNYIRTETNGRLRCHSTPAVAYRQLEASIGTVVVLLMVGFVAMISQQGPSRAEHAAAVQQPARQIVQTSVRVIPMFAPRAAALVQADRRS